MRTLSLIQTLSNTSGAALREEDQSQLHAGKYTSIMVEGGESYFADSVEQTNSSDPHGHLCTAKIKLQAVQEQLSLHYAKGLIRRAISSHVVVRM